MALVIPNNIANAQPADGDLLDQNFDTVASYVNTELVRRDGQVAMTAPLLLPGPPTEPNQAATKAYVDASGPTGSVIMFAGDAAPTGYLFCRGQLVPRTTYAALFAIIGTKFGVGDGSTTFALPNYQATLPVGFNTGTNTPPDVAGYIAQGVGERWGSANSVASHYHGTAAHQHDLQNHAHRVDIYTGGQTANHYHTMGQELAKHSPFAPTHSMDTFDGGGYVPIDFAGGAGSSYESGDHAHAVNGWSGGPNTNLTSHAAPDTGHSGTVAGNYPPVLSINFLIKT